MAELGENDIIYTVRVYCSNHVAFFRTTQTNIIDPTWKNAPTCAAHPGSVRDFVVESQEIV